ncbi:MAG: hypothetical protein WBA57_22665 [Elainellaceae cyanobacterium]
MDMKEIKLLLTFLLLIQPTLASSAESYLNTITKLDEERLPHRPYDEHLIENYDQRIATELYEVIRDTSDTEMARQAFYALGLVGSVMPNQVQLPKVINAVEAIETTDADVDLRLNLLSSGYQAIGRFGTGEARAFLLERVNTEFNAQQTTDTTINVIIENSNTGTPETSWQESIHSAALLGVVVLGLGEDLVLLNQLKNDPDLKDEPSLARAVDIALELHPTYASRHSELLEAFPEHLAVQTGKSEVLNNVELPDPLKRAVPVVIEEIAAPEPKTKEPAEVAPVEVVEETPEQSSQWWLWLIGLLVVVAGLGLVLRRKS